MTLFIVIALLSIGAPAWAAGASFFLHYLHPRVAFGERWKAHVVLVNAGQNATTVRLFAYDDDGNLLEEMSGGAPLAPGERRAYSEEDGAFPERTAALTVESDGLLLTSAVVESSDGKGLEAILPTTEPAPEPTFPVVGGGRLCWSHLVILNAGSVAARPAVVALDWGGHQLAKRFLPSLPPMASTTAAISDLFHLSPSTFFLGSITTVSRQQRSIFAEGSQLQVPSEHRRLVIESGKIWLEADQIRRIILRIRDLPQESRLAKGLALGRDRFSQAILSPSGNLIAFAVEGFHGWSGLYDLNQNKITEVAFFFQGRATQLLFSSDGRYLAIEALGGGGFSSVSLWDVQEDKALSWQAPKSPSGLPADVRIQEWVGHDLKILLRWVDEQAWQTWLLEVQEGRVLPRQLK